MSAAQHTPGPWQVYSQPSRHRDCAPTVHVCAAGDPKLVPCVAHIPGTEPCQEANARLIAAAPELLSNLEEVLSCLEAQAYRWTKRGKVDPTFAALLAGAHAVIAKARGQA